MDPVAHALLGAAVASAPAQLPLQRAALVGAVAALLPDLDVLIGSADDPLLRVEMHRHFTHALLVAPVLGALVAAVFGRFWKDDFWRLWLCASLAIASAGLLDACTSYGTHLLWPFTDERSAWSIVAVIDPLVWLALALPLGWALWARNVGLSAVALACCCAYLSIGAMQQQRALEALTAVAAERGHEVRRVVVKPTLGNLLVWRGIYQVDSAKVNSTQSLQGQQAQGQQVQGQQVQGQQGGGQKGEARGGVDIDSARVYVAAIRVGLFSAPVLYPGGNTELIRPEMLNFAPATRIARDVARFDRLSDGFVVRHPQSADVYGDVRFALRADGLAPMFGIRVDPQYADKAAQYLELRDWDDQVWVRFKAMLAGRPLPPTGMASNDTEQSK